MKSKKKPSQGIPFSVVGIGPGESNYRIPASDNVVAEADLLVGGERHLKIFHHLGKEELCLAGQISRLPQLIKERWLSQKLAILVSGDPGFHSLLAMICRNFEPEQYLVIPGISSFQVAAARTGRPWQDDLFLSLHGREPDNWLAAVTEALTGNRRVFFLTDKNHTPRWIGDKITSSLSITQRISHWDKCQIQLFYRLGHKDERSQTMTLSELVSKPLVEINKESLCVLIISRP